MFLDTTLRRNPHLIEAAQALHADGLIEPDTYVIDVDTVSANARALAATATAHGLVPWAVIKQIGRNPLVTRAITQHLPLGTAIDVREARALLAGGAHLGNVGHLVQIPRKALPEILAAGADHVTVYDVSNLRAVDAAARSLGIVQPIIARIAGHASDSYPGQEGGFAPCDMARLLETTESLAHTDWLASQVSPASCSTPPSAGRASLPRLTQCCAPQR